MTYGPPAKSSTSPPATLTVLDGTFQQGSAIVLTNPDGSPLASPSVVPHGACAAMHYMGTFLDATFGSYTAEVASGVTWSSSGVSAHETATTPPQYCPDVAGEGTVKGCYSGSFA